MRAAKLSSAVCQLPLTTSAMMKVLYPSPAESANLSTRKTPAQFRFHVPDGLDLSGLCPELHEYAYYFVSLIIRRRQMDARLKHEEYVPLMKRYLQNFVPWADLQTVLDYLIHETKQIESDGFYVRGQKSVGYKLSERLEDSRVTIRTAQTSVLRRKLSSEWNSTKGNHRPVHRHLLNWLNKVEIDHVTDLRPANEPFSFVLVERA